MPGEGRCVPFIVILLYIYFILIIKFILGGGK